jgi:hypothetical protein
MLSLKPAGFAAKFVLNLHILAISRLPIESQAHSVKILTRSGRAVGHALIIRMIGCRFFIHKGVFVFDDSALLRECMKHYNQ